MPAPQNRRGKLLGVFFGGLVLLVAGAQSIAAESNADPRSGGQDAVYRLSVVGVSPSAEESWIEWVNPASGEWRSVEDNRLRAYSKGSYVVRDLATGDAYERSGSSAFLGYLAESSHGLRLLQAHLGIKPGSERVVVSKTKLGKTNLRANLEGGTVAATIEEVMSVAEAQRRQLFDTRSNGRNVEREVTVGQPATIAAVKPYWLGPAAAGAAAAAAIERVRERSGVEIRAGVPERSEVSAYVVFYEIPAAVGGRSSAQPGVPRPKGEIQISSTPVHSAYSEAFLSALDGKNSDYEYPAWPRAEVELKDGETAMLIPHLFESYGETFQGFSVVTATTLINVTGDSFTGAEAVRLASGLRSI